MTLAERLRGAIPDLRGPLVANVPLKPLTWFKTGGPAEALFEPDDEDDLAEFLSGCPREVPVCCVGLGSNLLVRDGGVDGVVIRLGRRFGGVTVDDGALVAGAAVPDVKLASVAAQAGVGGFAFLRGIPGCLGGALRMNAGAYGGEIKDVLVEARGVARDGSRRTLHSGDMALGYRHCGVEQGFIFTGARLLGASADPAAIRAEMAAITSARGATQPIATRTGGSTFRNPPGAKAWQLIDAAGCRGLVHGDAQVSELHTNFLINRGNATAADLEGLGEMVRARVFDTSGIDLQWEIARLGRPA